MTIFDAKQRAKEWMQSTCPAAGGPRLWGEEPSEDDPGCDCEATLAALLTAVRDEALEDSVRAVYDTRSVDVPEHTGLRVLQRSDCAVSIRALKSKGEGK